MAKNKKLEIAISNSGLTFTEIVLRAKKIDGKGVSRKTLYNAVHGEDIAQRSIRIIAKVLGRKANEIFDF